MSRLVRTDTTTTDQLILETNFWDIIATDVL